MPKPTSSYIAAMSVRFLLTQLGKQFGYEEFDKNKHKKEWAEINEYFGGACCYCGKKVDKPDVEHIIGFNKGDLGFDCLGNVAPACKRCNNDKPDNGISAWEIHLKKVCGTEDSFKRRREKILSYMKKYNYPPSYFEEKILLKYQKPIEDFYKKIVTYLEDEKNSMLAGALSSRKEFIWTER